MPAEPPPSLDSDFHADFSHGEPARTASDAAQPVDHHCQVCPTCSQRLSGHRCKLVCSRCGYYMSCADYY
jgi:hypothetical protein